MMIKPTTYTITQNFDTIKINFTLNVMESYNYQPAECLSLSRKPVHAEPHYTTIKHSQAILDP